jgi:hypothetical protein
MMSGKEQKQRAEIMIRPYTLKELAGMYYVTPKTFRAWLPGMKLGDRKGRYYSVAQVTVIITELGFPYKMREPE